MQAENRFTSRIDSSNIRNYLLNRRRIRFPFQLPSDYDNIFLVQGLSRRSDRPLPDPVLEPPVEFGDFIFEWLTLCLDDHSPEADIYTPEHMELFDTLLEHFLPARLDLNTWIAREMMVIVAIRMTGEYGLAHELQPYHPSMSFSHRTAKTKGPNGKAVPKFAFLGEARAGRLVWVPRNGYSHPLMTEQYREYHEIRGKLRAAELALVL